LRAVVYHLLGQQQIAIQMANDVTGELLGSHLRKIVITSLIPLVLVTQIHIYYKCLPQLQLDYYIFESLSKLSPLAEFLFGELSRQYSEIHCFPLKLSPKKTMKSHCYPQRYLELIHLPLPDGNLIGLPQPPKSMTTGELFNIPNLNSFSYDELIGIFLK